LVTVFYVDIRSLTSTENVLLCSS